VGDGFLAAGNLVLASPAEWWFGAGIPGEFPAFGKKLSSSIK
jgi:hypothetical protein